MFVDARQLAAGSTVETRVCIIGAGAAGITLARELAAQAIDVCVVESGGIDLDAATQSLYEAESAGLAYFPLDANRQRSFGGSTNLWAGWCRPLDTIDLAARHWVPLSGWPLTPTELLPYYQRAGSICELPPSTLAPEQWEQPYTEQIVAKVYRLSPPTRFGQAYRAALANAAKVRVLLHANALQLDTNDTARQVTQLRVGCLAGPRFTVRARHYVLAAGGIENARLLLVSDTVQTAGLGNQHDVVGRYFMEHIHFAAATLALPAAHRSAFGLRGGPANRVLTRLALSAVAQAEQQLLNHSAMLSPVHWYDPLVHAIVRRGARRAHPLRDRLPVAFEPGGRVAGQTGRHWRLYLTTEQAPNPRSRVTRSTSRDALGLPRVQLAWHTTALDQQTAERVPQLIGAQLDRHGMGRIVATERYDGWPPPPLQGLRGHHMGTTRMSTQPPHGVVDAQCRVHGIANLFIAGSSVFPTAGAGTPTLTIVALALRLADHLTGIAR